MLQCVCFGQLVSLILLINSVTFSLKVMWGGKWYKHVILILVLMP